MFSTVTDKGQVTLPKTIRDRLGIVPGTRIDFEVQGDDTLEVRVFKSGSDGLFGLLQRPCEAARTLEEIDAGVTTAVAERARRKR